MKDDSLVALRVAHLSMIQAIVARLSGFSASAKTFTVTILAGLAALSLQADSTRLGVIAMVAAIALFTVDSYYLALEIRFRNFYDDVAERGIDQAGAMGITPTGNANDFKKALSSKSNLLFYGSVLFACALLYIHGRLSRQDCPQSVQVNSPHVEQAVQVKPTSTKGHP